MAKKKKVYRYADVMWRLKSSYYVNRWGMHMAEIECLQCAINGFMITSKPELLLLKSFGFDVCRNLAKLDPDNNN